MTKLLPINGDPQTMMLVTLFRLNGALLTSGDRLVADLGLTAARWQVLGVVANTSMPLPLASIARNMGLTRQGVRQVVGELVKREFVRLETNPHHRRANLVVLTAKGRTVHGVAKERWDDWTRLLAQGLGETDLRAATSLMQSMLARLDTNAISAADDAADA